MYPLVQTASCPQPFSFSPSLPSFFIFLPSEFRRAEVHPKIYEPRLLWISHHVQSSQLHPISVQISTTLPPTRWGGAPQSRHLRLLSFVNVLTPTAHLFPVLPPPPSASLQLLLPSLPAKPDWCFLHLYSPTTMTPAPLPLYVTTLSLTQKVRTLLLSTLLSFPSPLFYFLFSFHFSC